MRQRVERSSESCGDWGVLEQPSEEGEIAGDFADVSGPATQKPASPAPPKERGTPRDTPQTGPSYARGTPSSAGPREGPPGYRESPRGSRDGAPGFREAQFSRYEVSPRDYGPEPEPYGRRRSGASGESHGVDGRGGPSGRGRGGARRPGWHPRDEGEYEDDGYYGREERPRRGRYDGYEEEGGYGDYAGYGEAYVDPSMAFNVILAPIPGAIPLVHAPVMGGYFSPPGRGRMAGRGRMPMRGRGPW